MKRGWVGMAVVAAIVLLAMGSSGAVYGPVLDPAPHAPADCNADAQEIVVCARVDHPTNQRLTTQNDPAEGSALPPAEVRLGQSKLSVHAENGSFAGVSDPRIMIGIAIPF